MLYNFAPQVLNMRKKVGFILYFCARMSILSLRTYAFHHVLSWITSDDHYLD